MGTVGVRELKQNASAVVARAVKGETVTITHRGRPVALLTGITRSPLEQLIENGEVELPTSDTKIWEMEPFAPSVEQGEATLSDVLAQMRQGEKW